MFCRSYHFVKEIRADSDPVIAAPAISAESCTDFLHKVITSTKHFFNQHNNLKQHQHLQEACSGDTMLYCNIPKAAPMLCCNVSILLHCSGVKKCSIAITLQYC